MFKLIFTTGNEKLIYVPEDAVFSPEKFKRHFDKQEQEERMTLLAPQKAWKDLMRKLVLVYPTLPVTRTLRFVENIGLQVCSSKRNILLHEVLKIRSRKNVSMPGSDQIQPYYPNPNYSHPIETIILVPL